ncbi:MAG: AAA-like domain-containing protein [Cyanobacteria bacterium P01_F01_bin.42]
MSDFYYQVGGSLISSAPSYIPRAADQLLYEALIQGEFCYVLNSRQMGKSSLMVQVRDRLKQTGCSCAVLDMTNIGSENVTPPHWYKGIVTSIGRSFQPLRRFGFRKWWSEQGDLPLPQLLNIFIDELLLPSLPDQDIFIFIDEIDSILSLPFAVDDFFAFIRACYNQRAIDSRYRRLQFAIFGVAKPADLIRDRTKTPFNIGTAIPLNGFSLEEAMPLAAGFQIAEGNATEILRAILDWTKGQPFLTQKLCQLVIRLVQESANGQVHVPPGSEAYWIDTIVQTHILKDWENQDEPEHLRTIRNRVLSDPKVSGRLLGRYQHVLRSDPEGADSDISAVDSVRCQNEEQDLILSGLVVYRAGSLQVKNRIYRTVFNLNWVNQQLNQMRPYSRFLTDWLQSERQDESRLLRGQALADAQQWTQGKRLSDEDYQYLAASVEADRRQVQQALEAERGRAITAELIQTRKAKRLANRLLMTMSAVVLLTIGLGISLYSLYREANQGRKVAQISEMKALLSSARGNFESHRQLKALEDAVNGANLVRTVADMPQDLVQQFHETTEWMLDRISAVNLIRIGPGLKTFDIDPAGARLATASQGGTIQIWSIQGERLQKISQAHLGDINALHFSPDGERLLSAGGDRTLKIWSRSGQLLNTLSGHDLEVTQAEFSPDGRYIASRSSDRQLLLWSSDGRLLRRLPPTKVFTWSPDSRLLAIIPQKKLIQLITLDGKIESQFQTRASTYRIRFSPDGQALAQASVDKTIRLWRRDGTLLQTLQGHEATVIRDVSFTRDGSYLASVSADKTVRLWQVDLPQDRIASRRGRVQGSSTLIKVLRGHQATVNAVQFSPDRRWLASAAEDGTLRIWQPFQDNRQTLVGHRDFISALAVGPDGETVVSVSPARQMHLWRRLEDRNFRAFGQIAAHSASTRDVIFNSKTGQIITCSRSGEIKVWRATGDLDYQIQESVQVNAVALSPDGQWLASALDNQAIHLRRRAGRFQIDADIKLMGHQGPVQHVAFSPDGQTLITSAADKTIKMWRWSPKLQTFELNQTLTGHQAEVRTLAFMPQSDRFVSASVDKTIRVWSIDGKHLRTLEGHQGPVWDLAVHPQSDRLVSASLDGTVKLWTSEGQLLRTFFQHQSAVRSVAFSPDGQQIISGGDDQRVQIWDYAEMLDRDNISTLCRWGKDYFNHGLSELPPACNL